MRKKKKQSLPEGTTNMTINLSHELKEAVSRSAHENYTNTSDYCRIVLQDAIDRGMVTKVVKPKKKKGNK